MARERIDQIIDLPFQAKAYKDYLNSPDDQARQAARYIQQLVRNGQLDAQMRTTPKFDEAQARGEAQRAAAITQTQQLLTQELPTGSPFGPIVEARAREARERITVEREKAVAQKRAANQRARQRGDRLPYPDVEPDEPVSTVTTGPRAPVVVPQQEAAMAARGGAQPSPAAPWTALINIERTNPSAWDPQNEILNNENGPAYALVRGGRIEVIPQAKFRENVNSLSREQRREQQQFMRQFWGSAYKGPTDGSLDPSGRFQSAMEQYALFATRQNYYQFKAAQDQGFKAEFKPFDDKALVGLSGGMGGGGASSTQRTVSITDFSDEQAAGILEQFYTDALGRRPNKKEAAKFAEILRREAARRPNVTTTTAGGGTTTIRQQAGFGADEARMLARETAEAQPQFRPRQLATTVFDGFMEALQGTFR